MKSTKNFTSIKEFADCKINNPVLVKQLESLGFSTNNPDGMTFKDVIVCSQIANAVKGDINAFKVVMSSMNEEKANSPLEEYLRSNRCYDKRN